MSLIFPKKPLYAPMLGTLGGGSARGFGRGAGGAHPLEIPFTNFSVQFENGGTRGRDAASEATYRNNASVTSDAGSAWLADSTYFSAQNGFINFRPLMEKTYRITARGAGVPIRLGGYGALIRGDFDLTPDDILLIVLGQQGYPYDTGTGSAGGGTFVVKESSTTYVDSDILVIAGGGGGGHNIQSAYESDGSDTTTGGEGTNGYRASSTGIGGPHAGTGAGQGGAGFYSGPTGNHNGASAQSFIQGARGGEHGGTQGGFGGGGAQGNSHGGGGGGYTGGGGSADSPYQGGGGGSFNNGANQLNTRGNWGSHGRVLIEAL